MSKPLDTLVLNVSEDTFGADAQFTVSIDGVAVPGTYSATTARSSGTTGAITISQALGAGPHKITVQLLNGVQGGVQGGQGAARDLLIASASLDGNTIGLGSVLNTAGGQANFTVAPPQDTLAIFVAQNGQSGAQFTVSVDGNQVGGTYTTTAQHAQGQFDQIYANGAFGAGPHVVTISQVGLAGQASPAITVGKVVFDGTAVAVGATLAGPGATATLSVGGPTAPVTVTPPVTPPPVTPPPVTPPPVTPPPVTPPPVSPPPVTSGADTLVLNVAEDAYAGDAQFTVSVDGKAVAGTYTATTLRSSGKTQAVAIQGNWGAGQHAVQVQLLNGYTGGTQSAVRDLFLASASLDGNTNGLGTVLQAGGTTARFVVQPPLDTLTLGLSQTGGQGNAQVTVAVDGVASGQTYTINGQHAQGQSDGITLNGLWGAGPHTILVTDVSPGNGAAASPTIFIDKATFDGTSGTIGAVLTSSGSTASMGAGGSLPIPVLIAGSTVVPTQGGTTGGGTTGGGSTGGGSTGGGATAGALKYVGVNLSGAEFGIPDPTDGTVNIGTFGTTYTYPTHAEIDYYASKGLNTIRLPFSWERLQPVENGPLDKTQLGYIDDIVHYAAAKGVTVDLDPHNYGFGYGNLIGSAGTPDSAFSSLWSQLATHYAGQSNVIFGLMNEPHYQTPQQWVQPVNDAIAAIRATGATQEILVPGTDYTGGDSWISSGNAAIFAANVVDPGKNMAFEIHQYSDSDGSGSSPSVVSTTIGVDRLTAVTQWAEQTGNKLFLGEFGAASDPASITNLTNTLTYMQQHAGAWQGITEWGGGPWWGNYAFGLDPTNGVTTPQVATLAAFAPKAGV